MDPDISTPKFAGIGFHQVNQRQAVYIGIRSGLEKATVLVSLFLIWPIFLVIAILIRLDSPGSALFKQERAGRHHLPFKIYKFRTMRSDTPSMSTEEMQRSGLKAITRLGVFLRRTSLDELPQLLNVLKGEMSLIGPRPALTSQFRVLQLREQWGIQQLLPGITGYAQVTGRDDLEDEEKVRQDLYYLQHLGLKMDVKIIRMTLISIFKGTGNK